MSERPNYCFPTEPRPEAIRLCDNCPIGEPETERYIAPYKVQAMDLSQVIVSKDERQGAPIDHLSLQTRRDIDLGQYDVGNSSKQSDVLVPTPCPEVSGFRLPPEAWSGIRKTGCPGPEEGSRKYRLFGERNLYCGLLRTIFEQTIE